MFRGLRWRSPADRSDREVVDEYLRSRSDAIVPRFVRASCGRDVYACAAFPGGRSNDAEDAVQEAWLRALSGSAILQVGIVSANLALRDHGELLPRARARSLVAGCPPRPARSRVRPDPTASDRRVARPLPPGYRAVLVLHDIEGYTHREIAHLLGIDEGTARSQLSRARSTFKRWLSGSTEEHDARRRQ